MGWSDENDCSYVAEACDLEVMHKSCEGATWCIKDGPNLFVCLFVPFAGGQDHKKETFRAIKDVGNEKD